MILFSKTVATLLKSKIECKRIGLSVIGLEVPHAHIHLIPINAISDMNFDSKMNITMEQLKEVQSKILK